MGKKWAQEELDYLTENWGMISINGLCKKLGRSKNAVVVKSQRIGLGAFLESGEYITYQQLLESIGRGSNSYIITSWVQNRSLPIKYKLVGSNRFRIIYIDDFWEWAKENRSFIDFSKFPVYALGKEPSWVPEQRKNDFVHKLHCKVTPWTKAEDESLTFYLKQYKYGYQELALMLQRTVGAIQRRICDLNLKERPLKADNHIKWKASEFDLLKDLIEKGVSYESMAGQIGKSSKALRGKVYSLYGTENLDKARKAIERSI